jgi:alginate O-acetyltransferase complex protein AlgJ
LIRSAPIDEHRQLNAFPSFSLLRRAGVAAFVDASNRWFEDHIGLRDLFIRTKNQIDYSLFDTSHKIYVGSDRWLFDRERTDDRFDIERLNERDFSIVVDSFRRLAATLGQRGVHLVLVGYPDKATIYKEYLPYDAPRPPQGDSNLDRLRASLATDPSIIFIDVQKLLLPLKGGPRLFNKTDLHPTLRAAIPVLREIVSRIASVEQRPGLTWHEKLQWRPGGRYLDGGEARFLALLRSFGENVEAASPMDTVGKSEPDGRWAFDQRQVNYSFGPSPIFRWGFESTPNNCGNRLPGAMLWGDSFSDTYEALWLPHYFCFMRRAKTPIERLPLFISDMPTGTKYFIFQFVDTYLPCEAPLISETLSISYSCAM